MSDGRADSLLSLQGVEVPGRLAHIDLTVQRGEVLALIGANGAGKTSVLGVMAGDIVPARGRVQLLGRDLAAFPMAERARRRAVLMQHADAPLPLPTRTVLGLAGLPWGEDGCAAAELLDALELPPLLPRLLSELAGGERQRVQIARVCAQIWQVPDGLLLLDEPANHLDVRHQRALVRLLRARATAGQSVVLAVHDLNLALAIADRVALLVDGRLLAIGEPAAVLTAPALQAAFGVEMRVQVRAGRAAVDVFAGPHDR